MWCCPEGAPAAGQRPGSGVDLLAQPNVGVSGEQPVPVIFPLTSWNPSSEGRSLRDWLAHQLVLNFPYLSLKNEQGITLASRLIDSQRILPVLDGFDEIAEEIRVDALRALNVTMPLVLTSRLKEYENAITTHGRPLRAAAAIQIEEVEIADLTGYLRLTTGSAAQRETKWDPVLTRLNKGVRLDLESYDQATAAENNLRAALSTPLMVSLARIVYGNTANNPVDLLD